MTTNNPVCQRRTILRAAAVGFFASFLPGCNIDDIFDDIFKRHSIDDIKALAVPLKTGVDGVYEHEILDMTRIEFRYWDQSFQCLDGVLEPLNELYHEKTQKYLPNLKVAVVTKNDMERVKEHYKDEHNFDSIGYAPHRDRDYVFVVGEDQTRQSFLEVLVHEIQHQMGRRHTRQYDNCTKEEAEIVEEAKAESLVYRLLEKRKITYCLGFDNPLLYPEPIEEVMVLMKKPRLHITPQHLYESNQNVIACLAHEFDYDMAEVNRFLAEEKTRTILDAYHSSELYNAAKEVNTCNWEEVAQFSGRHQKIRVIGPSLG